MLRNLVAGFRLAFFLPADARDFRISWLNLWLLFLLSALLDNVVDYYGVKQPALFSIYGLRSEGFYFALSLFAGFLVACLFREQTLILAIPLVTGYALLVPSLLNEALLYDLRPDWTKKAAMLSHDWLLIILWCFLILLRGLLLFTGTKAKRQLVAVALLLAAVFLPGQFIEADVFWYHDDESDAPQAYKPRVWAEDALQAQYLLLQKELGAITPRTPGRNFYGILFAGYGGERVFMKESLYAKARLEEKYHAKGHIVLLVNSEQTLQQYPMATVTNLATTLATLGGKADVKQDMLFVYLTSHGAQDGTLSVDLDTIGLKQLDPKTLKQLLGKSGFRWKIVVVSACYSGSFIDALKDDDTLIMTAARRDRTSFGCGDELDFTYFGDAFFRAALGQTTDFIAAFGVARKKIEKMENAQHTDHHSEPQIFVGKNMAAYLKGQ